MSLIITCGNCHRRYDLAGYPSHYQFSCACGEKLYHPHHPQCSIKVQGIASGEEEVKDKRKQVSSTKIQKNLQEELSFELDESILQKALLEAEIYQELQKKLDHDNNLLQIKKNDIAATNENTEQLYNKQDTYQERISNINSLSGTSKIFISYRRNDCPYAATSVYKSLSQSFGRSCIFKDVDNIPLGENFKEYIHKIITNCEVMLVLIGQKWLSAYNDDGVRRLDEHSDMVRIEIESAIERKIPIIPVLFDGVPVPKPEELPSSISSLAFYQGISIRPGSDFDMDLNRLKNSIAFRFNKQNITDSDYINNNDELDVFSLNKIIKSNSKNDYSEIKNKTVEELVLQYKLTTTSSETLFLFLQDHSID